jgi:cysteine desulfurase
MGTSPDLAQSTIRVSLGWDSTEADVGRFMRSWAALYRRRRGFAGAARAA